MDCRQVRDTLIEEPARLVRALPEAPPGAGSGELADEVAGHLATCPACTAFAAQQRELDERLARAFAAPTLSPAFRPALRARLRRERDRTWCDALPDIVHLASCAAATLACAALAPIDTPTVLASGTAIALGSYIIVSALLQSLDELEQLDR
jgi:anti-sigma factor RsiW